MSQYPVPFFKRVLRFCAIFIVVSLGFVHSIQAAPKENAFSAFTLPPASGKKPESIVILLHGYGDTAENFLFLGAALGHFLPDTLFVALNAPFPCKTIPSGRQWLCSPRDNHPKLLKEIKKLTPSLNQYLDNLLKIQGLPPEKMAFLGFSQGARVALHIGLRRSTCAGIVAISGCYLPDPEEKKVGRPPILILHGTEDKMAPVFYARNSYAQLEALKIPVTLILLPGIGHDVDPQGIEMAGEFLRDCFSRKAP